MLSDGTSAIIGGIFHQANQLPAHVFGIRAVFSIDNLSSEFLAFTSTNAKQMKVCYLCIFLEMVSVSTCLLKTTCHTLPVVYDEHSFLQT